VSRAALVAVDGGGSKVDAVVVTRDGTLLGAARVGPSDGARAKGELAPVVSAVEAASRSAGADPGQQPVAPLGVFCLAGADLPSDERSILRRVQQHGWTGETVLRNDTFAVLRAGTDRTWGVGVVCGFGTNCSAVAPDGRTYRFPALGWIAGDWGGGSDIGEAALWHAVRSEDGRGLRTALASRVAAHFGFRRPRQVMQAMYFGRLAESRVAELPPLVFAAAAEGDAVATSIVDRQADEIVAMAGTAIRRLRMTKLDVHVVLGGGIFRNRFAPFFDRIDDGIREIAPTASLNVLEAPPVLGAALLGLDRLGANGRAKARLQTALTDASLDHRLELGERG
jgi:N-acetylglucosamine kinase-like BadF-type ATPase